MITAVIVTILIICILCATLRVELSVKGKELVIKVFLFGIPVFKLQPKGEKRKTKKETPEKKAPVEEAENFKKSAIGFREKISRFADVCKTAARLLRRGASVEKVSLNINIGTGDAAITAISTGALWAVVYSLIGTVGSIVYIKNHNVNITPCYQQSVFEVEGKCIFKSRLVHIIIIVITIFVKVNHLKEE